MWTGLRQRRRLVAPDIDASAASTHETPRPVPPYTAPKLGLGSRCWPIAVAITLCVMACDAGIPPHLVHGQSVVASAIATLQPDVDAIARLSLERFESDRAGFPDSGLIETDPVVVKSDLSEPLALTISPRAVPSNHFTLRSHVELLGEANRTGKDVTFIFIDNLELNGNNATVWVGTSILRPRAEEVGLCCCSRQDKFAKRDGQWVSVKTTDEVCS